MANEPIIAYCVKCKTKQQLNNAQAIYTNANTPATKGSCSVCGTGMFKMGYTLAHKSLPKPEPKPRAKKEKPEPKGKLVIVESPAKARTISKFLGKDYVVKASVGHVRDLLRSQLSVDVENKFTPKYRIPNEKRPLVKELKEDCSKSAEIYLATDADREGEAIAWHLMEAVGMEDKRVRRVVFHEITKEAINHAFSNYRSIDLNRINAQQTRRILDRLVGYKISPLLWQRVRSRTSAGRVQSVALRLICERDEEITNFDPLEYWSIKVQLGKQDANLSPKQRQFIAKLIQIKNKTPAIGKSEESKKVVADLKKLSYKVDEVKRGKRRRKPQAPFITSTLQQEASQRLGFRTRKTMQVAQQLYEGVELAKGEVVGLITYMRTDSTHVATQAQEETRALIIEKYGAEFLPKEAPEYKTKSRSAQEAHEAIRPTSIKRLPSQIKEFLSRDQYRLYNLIWLRFVASQMAEAIYQTMRIDISAGSYLLRASGSKLQFTGFLSLYEETVDEDAAPDEETGIILPDLTQGEALDMIEVLPEQHFTQPPPRYTEASLIKTLEEFGIGRPSTYAPTISTIQDRGYVERSEKRLYPTEIGTIVNDLVVEYFPNVINVEFTAKMEADLDKIANGQQEWVPILETFYTPFELAVKAAEANMPTKQPSDMFLGEQCEKCGNELIIKYGRFGKFIACSNFPDCRFTRPFIQKIGVICPTDGGEIVERKTKKGRIFYGCSNYPECEWTNWKRPISTPCPSCNGLLIIQNKKNALCTVCKEKFELESLTEPITENVLSEKTPVPEAV